MSRLCVIATDCTIKLDDRVARWAYEIPAYKANLLKTKLADLIEPAKGS